MSCLGISWTKGQYQLLGFFWAVAAIILLCILWESNKELAVPILVSSKKLSYSAVSLKPKIALNVPSSLAIWLARLLPIWIVSSIKLPASSHALSHIS